MRADAGPAPVRVDKWLWAARFFKTRALAQDAVENGRVLVQGERVKVARLLKGGELLRIRTGDVQREVVVMALSSVRGADALPGNARIRRHPRGCCRTPAFRA